MTNEAIFCSQWDRVKEEIIEKMNNDLKRTNRIAFKDVNKAFKDKLLRWEGIIRNEGRWLEDVEDEEKKREFISKLRNVRLVEVKPSEAKFASPGTGALIGGICGLVLAFVIPVNFAGKFLGVVLKTLMIMCGVLVPTMVLNNKKKLAIHTQNESVLREYVKQIENIGKELAEIWR